MENAAERRQSKKPGKDIPGNSQCHGRAVGRRYTGGLTWRDIHTLTVENFGLKSTIQNTVETGLTASPPMKKPDLSRRI